MEINKLIKIEIKNKLENNKLYGLYNLIVKNYNSHIYELIESGHNINEVIELLENDLNIKNGTIKYDSFIKVLRRYKGKEKRKKGKESEVNEKIIDENKTEKNNMNNTNNTNNDKFFPLINNLYQDNTEIIKNLKSTVENLKSVNENFKSTFEDALNQINNANINLYSNQATLLQKNNELLAKQEKALKNLFPKKQILLENPEAVKVYWREKTKFVFTFIILIMSLLVVSTCLYFFNSRTYKIQKFLDKAVIETTDNGERFLLLEEAESFHEAKTGEYVIWKEDNIAIPLNR